MSGETIANLAAQGGAPGMPFRISVTPVGEDRLLVITLGGADHWLRLSSDESAALARDLSAPPDANAPASGAPSPIANGDGASSSEVAP